MFHIEKLNVLGRKIKCSRKSRAFRPHLTHFSAVHENERWMNPEFRTDDVVNFNPMVRNECSGL
jgi:hypothetical protein